MMRQSGITILLLIFCVSCNQKKMHFVTGHEKLTNLIDNSQEFLKLFQDIDPRGFHIYPFRNLFDNNTNNTFKGIAIDVKKYNFIDNNNLFPNIEQVKKGQSNIYAIGKFDINEKYEGLIFRQWSQYDESLIELMLWDKSLKRIITSLPLADSFGDAGWYFDLESWIKDFQYGGQLVIISRKKDFIPKENFTIDDEIYSVITDSMKINSLKEGKFIINIEKNIDTTNYKLKNWK